MANMFLRLLFIVFELVSVIFIGVGVIHFISPLEYRWLSQDEVIALFLSGLILNLFVIYFSSLLD